MRPVRVTVSAHGASTPIPMDVNQDPFNASLAVTLSIGAVLTYTVEHTFDDVFANGFNPATATWFPNAGMASKTTSLDGNYVAPVTAIRLNITAYSEGSATLTVIQAGMPGR